MNSDTTIIKQPSPPNVVNQMLNALISVLLRSSFHKLLSGSALVLSFQGRKSQKTYTFPVGYYHYTGDRLAVIPLHAWWVNLKGNVPVTVWLKGKRYAGIADAFKGNEAAVRELQQLILESPNLIRVLQVKRLANGQPDAEHARSVASNLPLVRIQLTGISD